MGATITKSMSSDQDRRDRLAKLVEDLGEFYDAVTVVATIKKPNGMVGMEYATSGSYYESMGMVDEYLRSRRKEGEVIPVEIVADYSDDDEGDEWRGEPQFD